MSRYRYAGYSPKSRHHGQRLNLHEIMHLIISLQMLFGSRRGGTGLLLLIVVVGVVIYFGYTMISNPSGALSDADAMWGRDDKVGAIKAYKELLRKRDPLGQNGEAWLQDSRPRLYRRIITFEAEYGDNPEVIGTEVRDWIEDAWNEGHHDLRFDSQAAQKAWNEVTVFLKKQDSQRSPLDDLIPD